MKVNMKLKYSSWVIANAGNYKVGEGIGLGPGTSGLWQNLLKMVFHAPPPRRHHRLHSFASNMLYTSAFLPFFKFTPFFCISLFLPVQETKDKHIEDAINALIKQQCTNLLFRTNCSLRWKYRIKFPKKTLQSIILLNILNGNFGNQYKQISDILEYDAPRI